MIIGTTCPHCSKPISISMNVEKINILEQAVQQNPQPSKGDTYERFTNTTQPIRRRPIEVIKRGTITREEKEGAKHTLDHYHEMKKRRELKKLEQAKKDVGYDENTLNEIVEEVDKLNYPIVLCGNCNHMPAHHFNFTGQCSMYHCVCQMFIKPKK